MTIKSGKQVGAMFVVFTLLVWTLLLWIGFAQAHASKDETQQIERVAHSEPSAPLDSNTLEELEISQHHFIMPSEINLRQLAPDIANPSVPSNHPALASQATETTYRTGKRTAQILTGFASLDAGDCCLFGETTPPDPHLAVGPDHILVVVNSAMAIYDKSGGIFVGPVLLEQFFNPLGGQNCTGSSPYHANALYDEKEDRFFIGVNGSGAAYCTGVSKSGDPTGGWWLYEFPTNINQRFFEDPHAGIGETAIYIGANMYQGTAFAEGRVWAFDKFAMYSGTPAASATNSTGFDASPYPINLHGAGSENWPASGVHSFIASRDHNAGTYALHQWEDPFGDDIFSHIATLDLPAIHGLSVGLPVETPQNGGHPFGDNAGVKIDYRPLDFEYQEGYGWTTMNVGCDPGGGIVNCVQWAQINLETAEVVQGGIFASPGEYRIFPSIAANICQDVMIGYTKSNSGMYPGAYAAGRKSTDAIGVIGGEIELKAGEVTYTGIDAPPYRWGRYTEMTIDPDGLTFWYIGEYSKDRGASTTRWGTYVSAIQMDGCGSSPDYTISIQPSYQQVCVNEAVTYTVQLDSLWGFALPVTLTLPSPPGGLLHTFTPNPVIPPGSSVLTLNTTALASGAYSITVQAAGPDKVHSTFFELAAYEPISTSPMLISPSPGSKNIGTRPTLSWEGVPQAAYYEVQISEEPEFAMLEYSATVLESNHIVATHLVPGKQYFWRVQGVNACGAGSYSTAGFFYTGALHCRDSQLAIPDTGSALDAMVIHDPGTIVDLDVWLKVSHSYVGDLEFALKHPGSATQIRLIDRPGVPATQYGCSSDDIDAILDDASDLPVEDVCGSSTPTIAGSFQPNDPLAAFNGLPLAGTWELKAFDHNIGDTGSVIKWCLLPELSPPTFSLSPTRLDISIEPGKSQTGTITITNTGDSTLFWYITTTSGKCDQPNGLEWASVVPNNRALLPGEGTITYFEASQSIPAVTKTGQFCIHTNAFTPTVALPITVTPDFSLGFGTIQGEVKLKGQSAIKPARVFIQAVRDGGLFAPFIIEAMPGGYYELPLPVGIYTITVEAQLYLDAEIYGITVTASNTTILPLLVLPGGDTNDDDIVNIFDLSLISSLFGLEASSPGWDARGDINQDLIINIQDIALCAGNYGKKSLVDVPWSTVR